MSYTVGVKRRLLPGFKKYVVKGHDWKDFRFILNLSSGEQVQIPGFRCPAFKVYSDFWIHHAQVNEQIQAKRVEQMIVPRSQPDVPRGTSLTTEQVQSVPTLDPNRFNPVTSSTASPVAQTPVELALAEIPEPRSAISEEARINAANRVRTLFQSANFAEAPGSRPGDATGLS